jgi:hypothetical protein
MALMASGVRRVLPSERPTPVRGLISEQSDCGTQSCIRSRPMIVVFDCILGNLQQRYCGYGKSSLVPDTYSVVLYIICQLSLEFLILALTGRSTLKLL